VALAELKRLRFNTVANWSEWEYAARARFPYVRPMSFRGTRSSMIYRDFPMSSIQALRPMRPTMRHS